MLKKIINQSKHEAQKMFDAKVKIKAWVKVRPDWQKKEIYLDNIKNRI